MDDIDKLRAKFYELHTLHNSMVFNSSDELERHATLLSEAARNYSKALWASVQHLLPGD